MPTYEYQCTGCGIRFEEFQKISDEPVAVCPECGGKVKRIISAGGGFILKGAGFYANDYAGSSSGSSGCGRESPCCGRDIRCDRPPCEK